jgi:hypothetical protein
LQSSCSFLSSSLVALAHEKLGLGDGGKHLHVESTKMPLDSLQASISFLRSSSFINEHEKLGLGDGGKHSHVESMKMP